MSMPSIRRCGSPSRMNRSLTCRFSFIRVADEVLGRLGVHC
jgi:hypothetical protein